MKRKFTKYPQSYVRSSSAWAEGYLKEPYGFSGKSFDDYTIEDWAYCLADELGLFSDDYYEILYNLKNLPADKWIDEWSSTFTGLRRDIYKAFYEFLYR